MHETEEHKAVSQLRNWAEEVLTLEQGDVATYQDIYKLTYVRGPSGIIVMLAEELKKS